MKKFEYEGKWYQELDPKDYKIFDRVECLYRDNELKEWVAGIVLACVNTDMPYSFFINNMNVYRYCAIPCDPPKSRLMTNRELAELLCKGYGVYSDKNCTYAFPLFSFKKIEEDDEVNPDIIIRSWDSTEWIKPTIDIYNKFLNKDHQ